MKIEIFRAMLPPRYILNDNFNTHYKSHRAKLDALSRITRDHISGFTSELGFTTPISEDPRIKDIVGDIDNPKQFKIIYEVWKQKNIIFDLSNYTKTFKAIVDVFTSNGYWIDDNWKYIVPVVINGGGRNNWHHAIRYKDDNLPDELSYSWWLDQAEQNYTMVRIIISDEIDIK